jgi:hypothetical protein
VRLSAPALGSNIIGGINAPGFLYASHAFEISRIGGIRLLRSQSASRIVHAECPWYVPPNSHEWLKPALTLGDNLLTWDDDLRGSMRRLVAGPTSHQHLPTGIKV